jgi:hypothetical protein
VFFSIPPGTYGQCTSKQAEAVSSQIISNTLFINHAANPSHTNMLIIQNFIRLWEAY